MGILTGEVEVVGVYEVSDAADAHLIEVRSSMPPEELDIGGFTQEEPGRPRADWQVPWMEHWLDPSGTQVLTDGFDPPPDGLSTSRLAFFMHFLGLDRPLLTPAGPLELPSPVPLPERLASVRYEPVG